MQFTLSIVAAIAAASQLVAASPTTAAAPPQANGYKVTYCKDPNYAPPCVSDDFVANQCTIVDSSLRDAISSIKLDTDVVCAFYTDTACSSRQPFYVQTPGTPSLYGTQWEDALNSYQCYQTDP